MFPMLYCHVANTFVMKKLNLNLDFCLEILKFSDEHKIITIELQFFLD